MVELSLKRALYLFIFTILSLSLNSCLFDDDDDDVDYSLYTDAELISFSLSHDSVSELKNLNFTIDQRKSLIYNYDSLAYGTDIYKFEKVIVTYTSGAYVSNVMAIADGDSIWIASGDSLNISDPLTLRVHALDGVTTKEYLFSLNIHQMDPDSMQFHQLVDNLPFLANTDNRMVLLDGIFYCYSRIDDQVVLYRSHDATTWEQGSLTGLPDEVIISGISNFQNRLYSTTQAGVLLSSEDGSNWTPIAGVTYPVKALLGAIKGRGLSLVVEKEENQLFAFTSDYINFSYGSQVPENFPLSGFSPVEYELSEKTGQRVLSLIAGTTSSGTALNSVWTTQDGLYWSKLTDDRFSGLPVISGGNAFLYNGWICLMNGRYPDGGYNEQFYYSVNNGYSWVEAESKYQSPDYPYRSGASLVTDDSGTFFYIAGGINSTWQTDVWKAFLNRKIFDH